MGGPSICIGFFHPLFFVHVVVIAHTYMHMHMHTHVHTHWVIHTPTLACKYRPFSVGFPYRQPAPVTGMIDIRSFTRFQFPVVVTGMDNQLEKVYMSMHTSTYTWLVQDMHTEVLCMLPIVFYDCISHALYRNDLHALCNHSHATTFIWLLIW